MAFVVMASPTEPLDFFHFQGTRQMHASEPRNSDLTAHKNVDAMMSSVRLGICGRNDLNVFIGLLFSRLPIFRIYALVVLLPICIAI